MEFFRPINELKPPYQPNYNRKYAGCENTKCGVHPSARRTLSSCRRGDRMIVRRKIIALLGSTLLALPLEGRGQESGRTYRIST